MADAKKDAATKPRTPQQDALDAKPQRQAAEKQAAEAHDELEKAGKLVAPTAITGYEHERAKLGADPEGEPEADTTEK